MDDAWSGHLTDFDRIANGQITAATAFAARVVIAALLYPDAEDPTEMDLLAPEETTDDDTSRAWLLVWHEGPHGWTHKVQKMVDSGLISLPDDVAIDAVEATVLALTPRNGDPR